MRGALRLGTSEVCTPWRSMRGCGGRFLWKARAGGRWPGSLGWRRRRSARCWSIRCRRGIGDSSLSGGAQAGGLAMCGLLPDQSLKRLHCCSAEDIVCCHCSGCIFRNPTQVEAARNSCDEGQGYASLASHGSGTNCRILCRPNSNGFRKGQNLLAAVYESFPPYAMCK